VKVRVLQVAMERHRTICSTLLYWLQKLAKRVPRILCSIGQLLLLISLTANGSLSENLPAETGRLRRPIEQLMPLTDERFILRLVFYQTLLEICFVL